jgi:hypothetical protein
MMLEVVHLNRAKDLHVQSVPFWAWGLLTMCQALSATTCNLASASSGQGIGVTVSHRAFHLAFSKSIFKQ